MYASATDELDKEIFRRCGRRIIPPVSGGEDEEEMEGTEREEVFESQEEEEELPFEDILAEKRRKYNASEELIAVLYNDILLNFVNEWNGRLLRKKFFDTQTPHESETMSEEASFKEEVIYPKLTTRDEKADVTFISKNSYSGRISKKMMEGDGVYKWEEGVKYTGEFEENRVRGKGFLEWKYNCWYEGEFLSGYRHGRGTLADKDYQRLYIGHWHVGHRHGKGYCRYSEGDSYDGDWWMGKREGRGLRVYPSGARFEGEWKNDLRHGIGTMAWPNGDVYRGEWKYGEMHGDGVYTWQGFFNKSLSWPQELSYIGEWSNGNRHGRGLLKLKSIGGAKYYGDFKRNRKHGYGMIIGNNGEVVESDPLFSKDILISSGTTVTAQQEKNGLAKQERRSRKQIHIAEAFMTTVLRPEQFPDLSFHINRIIKRKKCPLPHVPSGKCRICEEQSCVCLLRFQRGECDDQSDEQKLSTPSCDQETEDRKYISEWQDEEREIYECLTSHIYQIRNIYKTYAKLFTKNAFDCYFNMTRMTLWQLLRDCKLHKKGLTLIEIDNYVAENKCTYFRKLHHPFEIVEFWQFLHTLLEVAYRIYASKKGQWEHGKLAGLLEEFLKNDIYPNVGNHVGLIAHGYYDLLPIQSVKNLYDGIGNPPTAKTLLIACMKGYPNASIFTKPSVVVDIPEYLLHGFNCVTVGEKIDYIPVDDIVLAEIRTRSFVKKQDAPTFGLLAFKELGSLQFIEIMAKVCPLIKDSESNIIVNMHHKLTFLEFYEIIMEATKRILEEQKMREEREQQRIAAALLLDEEIKKNVMASEVRSSTRLRKRTR